MIARVSKIFIIQICLFTLSILIIAFVMFYQQSINSLEEKTIMAFKAELKSGSAEVNYKTLIARENVKSLSSRTMIRKTLFSYHNNDISVDEVKTYTQLKYSDGAKVYSNLIKAVRTDVNNEIIAEYSTENFEMSALNIAGNIGFFKTDKGCNVYVKNEIIHNDTLIGYDTGIFFLECFPDKNSVLLENISVMSTYLNENEIDKYSHSFPIGDTGYFLTAELKQDVLTREKIGVIKTAFIQTVLLIAVVIFISYFTIFRLTFSLIKKLDTANNRLSKSLEDKELLLKEVHHRIKNNFSSIGSLLSMQIQLISNPEAISALQDAIGRVESMQVLYEKLLLTNDYQITSAREYLDNLIDEIIGLFPDSINVTVQKQIGDYQLDLKQLSPIGFIVNELLTNIMKYAFTGKTSGLIQIILKENYGVATLIIQDNGNGLPEGFDMDKQKGFGLMLVKMLSEQLEGNFTIENIGGTKSTLEFKF